MYPRPWRSAHGRTGSGTGCVRHRVRRGRGGPCDARPRRDGPRGAPTRPPSGCPGRRRRQRRRRRAAGADPAAALRRRRPRDGVPPARRRDRGDAIAAVERGLRAEGVDVLGWREVPVDPRALGAHARRTRPEIAQVLLRRPPGGGMEDESGLEAAAFRARRRIEREVRASGVPVYVASMSFATVTYKALCAADQLAAFYPDLADPGVEASFVVFHSGSRRTRARHGSARSRSGMLCHNGEINTIDGNERDARAAGSARRPVGLGGEELAPTRRSTSDDSDSAKLDEAARAPDTGRTRRSRTRGDARPACVGERPGRRPDVRGLLPRTTRASPSRGTGRPGWSSPTAAWSARASTATGCGPCGCIACDDGIVVVLVRGRRGRRRGPWQRAPWSARPRRDAAASIPRRAASWQDVRGHRPLWLAPAVRRLARRCTSGAGAPADPGAGHGRHVPLRGPDALQVAFGYTSRGDHRDPPADGDATAKEPLFVDGRRHAASRRWRAGRARCSTTSSSGSRR